MSSTSFTDYVVDQLGGLGSVEARAMFGGYGLYLDDAIFGIVFRGRLYFRVSDATVGEYDARGMKPFRPGPSQTLKRYYEVPADVLEDAAELKRWARAACGATRERKGAGAAATTADTRSRRGGRVGEKNARKRRR